MKVSMQWKGGLRFGATGAFGHEIHTDGAPEHGGEGNGFKPTELLLWGVAGCTGIDVLRILEKQRQTVESLEIEVIGEQPDEYPKPFQRVSVHYRASGANLDPQKLAKAIALSEEKYCVVSQTIQQPCEVTTSYEVV